MKIILKKGRKLLTPVPHLSGQIWKRIYFSLVVYPVVLITENWVSKTVSNMRKIENTG